MNVNPLRWFRASANGQSAKGPHITFAKSSMGRTVTRTGLFLRKQLWIWPLIAVALLAVVGFLVRGAIETTMKDSLRSQVSTMVDLESSMLQTWFNEQKSNAESLANSLENRRLMYQLLDPETSDAGGENSVAALRKKLDKALGPSLTAHEYNGYFVADRKKQIVAAGRPELIGQKDIPEYDAFLTRALDGVVSLSQPFASIVAMKDESGRVRTGVPTMFVCAPVRDDSFQVVGAVGFRIRPETEFTRILQLGRFGETGETYAFDRTGRMVSNSRFDASLVLMGLLPDEPNAHSILNILVRDPGGDITRGFRPAVRRRDLPLTYMAGEAIAARPGVEVDGYRDYRGVPVVGAWKWLPDADIGVATEIQYDEAFRPLTILRWTFWGLFALLVLSAIAIFVFTLLAARLRRDAQKAAIAAQQIGQYVLEQKLGAGGMGVVYKGRHAMLRRPTAIKMLSVEKVNDASLARFEHEVQITSQLNSPNTVAIYDYGRTPEGVFYYAMEYLDGIDLQSLVERYGPQSPARTIRILQQICSSLHEAHCLGLVHRDIKPANIMLNRRGGEPDVVKVLDFGLVKALDDHRQAERTDQRSLTGTPLYMSPESIQLPGSVDARSDLYAVGAVGYFLLTGQPVFDADNIVDLCQKHVATLPTPPSQRVRTPLPPELESALLSCLEKSRAKRPQTARELSQRLARCEVATAWSIDEADDWWSQFERNSASSLGASSLAASGLSAPIIPAATTARGYEVTIDPR